MELGYKSIAVFYDESGRLYGIPYTHDMEFHANVQIDLVLTLDAPYDDERLERFFQEVFGHCHEMIYELLPRGKSPLQKYTKARSYKQSVIDKGHVGIYWTKDKGYTMRPSWQNPKMRHAFEFMPERNITVPSDYKHTCQPAQRSDRAVLRQAVLLRHAV